jgi:hypothetical protein
MITLSLILLDEEYKLVLCCGYVCVDIVLINGHEYRVEVSEIRWIEVLVLDILV